MIGKWVIIETPLEAAVSDHLQKLCGVRIVSTFTGHNSRRGVSRRMSNSITYLWHSFLWASDDGDISWDPATHASCAYLTYYLLLYKYVGKTAVLAVKQRLNNTISKRKHILCSYLDCVGVLYRIRSIIVLLTMFL